MPTRPPARPPADPNSFDEAVAFFRDRAIMTDAEFQAIEGTSHATAFTVAGVAQLDMVTQVWEAADRAVSHGETLESFQKAMREKLAAAWGKDMPWRVETIYRTNVQVAYSRGRWFQMTTPAVLRARPFRRYSAILDTRTTTVCAACDNTVRPADDPWWNTHVPPLHHNCRSRIVTLSDAEAKREGVTPAAPADADPDEGFGAAPKPGVGWTPNLTTYPPQLVQVHHEPTKPRRQRTPKPPPAPPPPPPIAPIPVVTPGRPEGVKGQPFRRAATIDEAIAGLKGHGLDPIDGRNLNASRKPITVPDADRLDYLNGLLEVMHDIRERFPYWHAELARVPTRVCTYPTGFETGGLFTHRERAVVVPQDNAPRWQSWIDRLKARNNADPATRLDEAVGFSRQTFRHELAHALDVTEKLNPTTWSWYRFSEKGTVFNELWVRAARRAKKLLASFIREQVSDYANKNLHERFAETVMMVSSPAYRRGMLPTAIEDHVIGLLEKGPTP